MKLSRCSCGLPCQSGCQRLGCLSSTTLKCESFWLLGNVLQLRQPLLQQDSCSHIEDGSLTAIAPCFSNALLCSH